MEEDGLPDGVEQMSLADHLMNDIYAESAADVKRVNEGTEGEVYSEAKQELVKVKIGAQHFDLLKLLGEGAFGKVLLVRSRLDKQLYAMKVISKSLLRKKNNIQYIRAEKTILTKLEHPFLISLQFAFQTPKKLFLVMEFLAGGELFEHLMRRGLILEPEAAFYLGEIVL
eukprot:gene41777-50995_t